MKRALLAAILAALAVAWGLFSICWTDRYVEKAETALVLIESVPPQQAEEPLAAFREEWDRSAKFLACFIEENHLEKTEESLRLAEIFLSCENYDSFAKELKRLKLFLLDLTDYCLPTIDNIF